MRNIKIILEYDGSAYHGWQRQAGQITVQQVVEEKINLMTRGEVTLTGSGRTDAGVHALRQAANFMTRTGIEEGDMLRGLNGLLPGDIAVKELSRVSDGFHAQYDAKSKVYAYKVYNGRIRSPLLRNYAWHVYGALDLRAMTEAAVHLKGVHDFSSFCGSGHEVKSRVREIYDCRFDTEARGIITFTIEANGFLRYMVRNIIGTLVEVGRGKRTPSNFRDVLEARDRRKAGVTAPSKGLYLMDVKYE